MLLAEPAMDRMQALRQVGWVQPIDYILVFSICLSWATALAWKIFGEPTSWNLLVCAVVAGALTQLWLVILIFRCSHFVLLIHAAINTLPDEAARIVMAAHSGGNRREEPGPRRPRPGP